MPETEQEIWDEFRVLLNQAAFVFTTTLTSIDVYRPRYSKQLKRGRPHPDTKVGLNSGPLPNNPRGVTFAEVSQQEYNSAIEPRGLLARQTGVSWLAYTYASWEDNVRKRLADVRGVKIQEVKDETMGDLGKIRNDAVHLGARATAKNTGRCSTLRWFSPGDEIFIERWMVADVLQRFGLTGPAPTGFHFSFKI